MPAPKAKTAKSAPKAKAKTALKAKAKPAPKAKAKTAPKVKSAPKVKTVKPAPKAKPALKAKTAPKANTIKSALNQKRQQNKTGGGLGSLSCDPNNLVIELYDYLDKKESLLYELKTKLENKIENKFEIRRMVQLYKVEKVKNRSLTTREKKQLDELLTKYEEERHTLEQDKGQDYAKQIQNLSQKYEIIFDLYISVRRLKNYFNVSYNQDNTAYKVCVLNKLVNSRTDDINNFIVSDDKITEFIETLIGKHFEKWNVDTIDKLKELLDYQLSVNDPDSVQQPKKMQPQNSAQRSQQY